MELLKFYEKSKVYRKGGMSKEKRSLFVCGILLREILFPKLEIRTPKSEYSFDQMWYLICLHHDRRLEEPDIWNSVCRKMSRDIITSEPVDGNYGSAFSWSPLKLQSIPRFCFGPEGICFADGSRVKESLLSEEDINDAYHFRSACSQKVGMDHGMAGGMILYENLCRDSRSEREKIAPDEETLYSYLANVLIVHHLWENKRYKIKGNPLLCLLCLAEAMEPFQAAVGQYTEREVLKGTEFDILDGGIAIGPDQRYINFDTYAKRISVCVEMAGLNCMIEQKTGRIIIKMCETPIIDELFI